MFIADAHADTLSALYFEKVPMNELMTAKQKLMDGGVKLQTFALFAASKNYPNTPYENAKILVEESHKLDIPFYTGKLPENPPETIHGIYSIEGGEVLEGKIERLYEFHNPLRLRMIALTWNYENEIGYPAKNFNECGLKPFGFELLKEMDKLGIYADVSHLSERGFWDVYENMTLPLIASHSNCKELCDSLRNLTRDQIKAVIEKDGYIGMNFYPNFLVKGGENTCLDDVIRHIDYIAEMGGIGVLGLGSDFDGIEKQPKGLEDASKMKDIAEALAKRGYKQDEIDAIMGLNLWRKLKKAEK